MFVGFIYFFFFKQKTAYEMRISDWSSDVSASDLLPNDIYFKIGLIRVIGLAAKNAILIIEFAIEQRKLGRPLREAVIEAARLRFRPILMTSFAFIMGVLPMAVSTGAGANARHAIGTGVIGGMLFATFLGLLLIPVFYVVVRRLLGDKLDEEPADKPARAHE